MSSTVSCAFSILLLVVLQQYSATGEPREPWPTFNFNSHFNDDPFETNSIFTSHKSPFSTSSFNYDPFEDDPFFNPSLRTPPTAPLTPSNSKDSSSDSNSDEQGDYHLCPVCNTYHKKRPKVGDPFSSITSISVKPPCPHPPSSGSDWGTGAALAGGALAGSQLASKPNYHGSSKPTHSSSPPNSLSSSKPSTNHKPNKHGSSSSSSSEDNHKSNSGSGWPTGAALAGGALAGGLLASSASKPSTSKPPNYYNPSSNSPPPLAYKPPSKTHGVYHVPSKHDSSSSSEDKHKHGSSGGSGWSTGAALAGGALAGGLLASSASKPSSAKPPANNYGNQQQPPPTYQAPKSHKCSYCIREKCDPASCKEAANFNAKSDAERLHNAMKGLGTDEKTIIEILTQRSDEQIEEIRQEYVRFGRDMSKDLEGDTSFKTKELLDALVTPRSLFYAEQLEHAFKNKDTDTMIEIFTSLSDCAIREVSSEYSKRFRKALPESIEKKTCLDFENFLLELAKGNRAPNGRVDIAAAKKDADALINAGVSKWFGTDEDTFIKIFATRSWVQLKEVLKQYDLKRKPGIEKDISSETSGKLEKGLLTLVKNIKDQPAYFAKELEDSLHTLIKPGPNDNHKLIRIMRGRCGVDLGDIRDAYPKSYHGKKLADRLAGKTYMDYQAALLAMIKK